MFQNLIIGQIIVEGEDNPTANRVLLTDSNLVKVSIFTLPGCVFYFNSENNEIKINNMGLFNFSLPENLYDQELGIQSIGVSKETLKLLADAGQVAVVDYISYSPTTEQGEQYGL